MPATFSIPLGISSERRNRALHGQLHHHRNRRLAQVKDANGRTSNNNDEDGQQRRLGQQQQEASESSPKNTFDGSSDSNRSFHPSAWRLSHSTANNIVQNDGRTQHRDLLETDGPSNDVMVSVGLSNCHLVLYSGEVGVGLYDNLPVLPQRFMVDFDTGSADFWIPSSDCDETCTQNHPTWRLYNSTRSKTYQVASTDPAQNAFRIQYEDGEEVRGSHAKDTIWLGIDGNARDQDPLRVDNQVFAQVNHVQDFTVCEEEEGILGLANSMTTTHQFPSLLRNMMGENILRNNVFSLYLNSKIDDYDNLQPGGRPDMSSQLVLGGVDQTHYVGCLEWHPLLQPDQADMGVESSQSNPSDTPVSYWALAMDDIRVGGTSLVKPAENPLFQSDNSEPKYLGLLDSGSSYIVGPQESVAHLVQLNGAKCFVLEGENNPKQVDCNNADGFDGAVMGSCDDPFFNLEFIVNGKTYVLEKEDLMVSIETLFGSACILRIVGIKDIQGWVLGDAFLNKYYTAFDFENQEVGLALASKQAFDVCEWDSHLDINKFRDDNNPDSTIPTTNNGDGAGVQVPANGSTNPSRPEMPSGPTVEDQQLVAGSQGQNETETVLGDQEVIDEDDLALDDVVTEEGQDVFDFSAVEGTPNSPGDQHHEAPQREPVPNPDNSLYSDDLLDLEAETSTEEPNQSNITATSSASQSIQPASNTQTSSSGATLYIVLSAVIVGILGLIIYRRRRSSIQRKQREFQSMYQDAERAVVDSHKNTNYRDHSRVAYRDEETIDYTSNSGTDNNEGNDGFVLDAKMLNRMN